MFFDLEKRNLNSFLKSETGRGFQRFCTWSPAADAGAELANLVSWAPLV